MSKSRLLFVDNLRSLMIVKVILVHLAITYGGLGGWYYYERPTTDLSFVVLTFHNAVNQSFFMGLLFLLSAYLTVGSYDRKGPGPFLRDRFLRLGIPLLVFEFIIHPLLLCLLIKSEPSRSKAHWAIGSCATTPRSTSAAARSGSSRRCCSSP